MKDIFVGSSTEALQDAIAICDVLNKLPDVHAISWDDEQVFVPGSLTLEAIERFIERGAGALLLATPDVKSTFRGEEIWLPNPNITMELGIFSSRFGRERVALCKYKGVRLPTNLDGFTYVNIEAEPGQGTLPMDAASRLIEWAKTLGSTPTDIPTTKLLHGYSGRWYCVSKLKRWIGYDIEKPNIVEVRGYIDLVIPINGKNGRGTAVGDIRAEFRDPNNLDMRLFDQRIAVTDTIDNIRCSPDGSISWMSHMHSRFVQRQDGSPPFPRAADTKPGAGTDFVWDLKPCSDDKWDLTGTYHSDSDDRSISKIYLRKER